jgi:hypothetical protein
MVGSAGAAPTKVAAGHNGECGWQPIGVRGHEERDVPAAGGRLRGGKQGDFALRVIDK